MLAHPGRTITQFQISELFREAYEWAATVAVAVSNVFNNSGFVSLKAMLKACKALLIGTSVIVRTYANLVLHYVVLQKMV
jgi:hypothetical protein